jgi:hypothetical protein
VASLKALFHPLLLFMDGWQIMGWDHIRKFIPLDWTVIFRRMKNSIIDKIAPKGRNTCPILTFSGFPESLVSSAFLHMDGLANQGMGGWDHIRKFIPLDWSVIF